MELPAPISPSRCRAPRPLRGLLPGRGSPRKVSPPRGAWGEGKAKIKKGEKKPTTNIQKKKNNNKEKGVGVRCARIARKAERRGACALGLTAGGAGGVGLGWEEEEKRRRRRRSGGRRCAVHAALPAQKRSERNSWKARSERRGRAERVGLFLSTGYILQLRRN